MAFAEEIVTMLFDQHGQTPLADGGGKKGTLIFTGTLEAMRTNANFTTYGASRSGVRSLAQALAKEYSPSKCCLSLIDGMFPHFLHRAQSCKIFSKTYHATRHILFVM